MRDDRCICLQGTLPGAPFDPQLGCRLHGHQHPSRMPHASAAEPPELAAIRERVERDFVTDPASVSGVLSAELMQARIDRRALLANFDAELAEHAKPAPEMPRPPAEEEDEPDLTLIPAELIVRDPEICSGRPTMRGTRILAETVAWHLAAGTTWHELHEWYPSMPVPAAQPPFSAPGTVPESTGRGTGAVEAPGGSQGHWLKFDTIARTITGCQCGFRADMDSDCGWGDSVVAHLLEVAAEAAAPDVDGWSVRLVGGEVVVRHAADDRQLAGRDIPLGAILAFVADNPLTERTTT